MAAHTFQYAGEPVLEIPPLYCPLPSAIHPLSEKIGHQGIEWMTDLGLCDDRAQRHRIIACRSADWCCRIAPDGREAGLQIATDWTNLSFAFDDAHLDRGPSSRRPGRLLPVLMALVHVMDHPEARFGDDPYIQGYRDLSRRVREGFPAVAARNWADATAEWWFAAAAFVGYRSDGAVPDLADYAIVGPRDRAGRAAMALIELAEGTFLPGAERETPGVRAVSQAAYTLVTLGNDLFSFGREEWEEALESNWVHIFAHQKRCSYQEAVSRTVGLHDRIMCLFLELCDTLEFRADEQRKRYLGQLRHLVRGNLDYSWTVPRYNDEAAGTSTMTAESIPWAQEPSDGSLAPPRIPTIAWWWEELAASRTAVRRPACRT